MSITAVGKKKMGARSSVRVRLHEIDKVNQEERDTKSFDATTKKSVLL